MAKTTSKVAHNLKGTRHSRSFVKPLLFIALGALVTVTSLNGLNSTVTTESQATRRLACGETCSPYRNRCETGLRCTPVGRTGTYKCGNTTTCDVNKDISYGEQTACQTCIPGSNSPQYECQNGLYCHHDQGQSQGICVCVRYEGSTGTVHDDCKFNPAEVTDPSDPRRCRMRPDTPFYPSGAPVFP